MEAADRLARRQQQSRKRRAWWGGLALVFVAVAVVVGLAVGITERMRSHGKVADLRAQILLPLYAAPYDGAWDPIYQQLQAHTGVNFTIVVNPANGPVNTTDLDTDWKTNLEKLNTYSNARPVGYVNTQYSANAIDLVLGQTREYATWSYAGANGTYGVEGIYYDRVAANRTTEGAINYGMMIDWMVKVGTGFSPRQTVIHNTGVIPSYFDNTTDITVVFDGTYAQYQEQKAELSKFSGEGRMGLAYMVNSLPVDTSADDLKAIVKEMSVHAGNLYITDGDDSFSSFGSSWSNFVEAVADLE